MERSEILSTMSELKLYGMKAAFDEIIATAVKRQHEPQRVIRSTLLDPRACWCCRSWASSRSSSGR